MCKKLFFLVGFVVAVGLAGNAFGAVNWDDGGADHYWKTAENWSADIVPTDTNTVNIKKTGSQACIIDSSHTGPDAAKANTLKPGTGGVAGELQMTGGSLTTSNWFRIGNKSLGTFYMAGGTVAIGQRLHIGKTAGDPAVTGEGTLIMTAGVLSVADDLRIGLDGSTGHLQLDGGTRSGLG